MDHTSKLLVTGLYGTDPKGKKSKEELKQKLSDTMYAFGKKRDKLVD